MTDRPRDPRYWPAVDRHRAASEMMKWLLDETALQAGGLMRKVNGLHDEFERLERIAQDIRIEYEWCRDEDF